MGEGVWDGIVKGPVHRKVDEFVNTSAANRKAFITAVQNAATAAQYVNYLNKTVLLPDADANYLLTWWYNKVNGFWKPKDVYPVLKEGLLKALALADAGSGLPLDSYWSTSGHGRIEVFVTKSRYQVTRIIVTPSTPAPVTDRTEPSNVWIVRESVGTPSPGMPADIHNSAIVESVNNGITTWAVRDLRPNPPHQEPPARESGA